MKKTELRNLISNGYEGFMLFLEHTAHPDIILMSLLSDYQQRCHKAITFTVFKITDFSISV